MSGRMRGGSSFRRWVVPIAVAMGAVGGASAELIDRGGGLIYDTVSDITWLQDANITRTTGLHETGLTQWEVAMSWAAKFEYYDPVRDTTWADWRLPDARNPDGSGPCFGSGCSGAEHGHLYVDLGIRASAPGPFINLSPGSYWTSTRRAPLPGHAWLFNLTLGKVDHTGPLEEDLIAFAHLVRDGDVAPPPVAAPALDRIGAALLTLALLLALHLYVRSDCAARAR